MQSEDSVPKQQQELKQLNQQLQARAQKFGSQFTPLSMTQYKLFKIQKASETGNIQYLQNILLEEIEDLKERKNKIKERAKRFFPNVQVESNPDKFFNSKTTPDFTSDTTVLRYETWYLFGVDYMSNEKIRNYFHINPHFRIEWINDSSCNISFNSKQQAEAAVRPFIKMQEEMIDEKDEIWYELGEYEVEGIRRKLYCRIATNKDVKMKQIHGHNSQYYRWQLNKKKINNYVKNRANQQINKTKAIKRDHVKKKVAVKKQEQDSSSGIDSSEQEMK